MNVQATVLAVTSGAGVTTRNLYIQHQPGAPKLAVLLPGANYTCDRPALYYLRQIALRQGFDVLCLEYGFAVAGAPVDPEQALAEAEQALGLVMAERSYQEVCFIGKSMGTPIALTLAAALDLPGKSAILLTPVGAALGPLEGLRALSVIGTEDRVYGTPEHRKAAQRAGAQWVELEGVGHNLDHHAGWAPSLEALQRLLQAAEQFLS
jgi:predicted esterase